MADSISMPGIRIVTDSACDISAELASELDIIVVPLTIRFGDEELVDRRDLSVEEFWRRCAEGGALPQTSAPPPGAFQEAYEQAAAAGVDGVLCITISSGMSGTYQSALAAVEAVADRIAVQVIDSTFVTMGQGLLVIAAAEAAAAPGADLDTVARTVKEGIGRTRVFGALATLDHLQRGGRIGGLQALVGSLLSIKPVVEVRGGLVAEESKQRTRRRSLDYLADKVRSSAPLERLAVCSGQADDLDELLAKVADVEVTHRMLVAELGPVVATHAGPGVVGVAFMLPPAG